MRCSPRSPCFPATLAGILLAGCASPGPPLPPTLNLPAVISSGLTATRVGDEVQLHWTTSERTTDKLPIKGAITAVICREVVPAPMQSGQNTPQPPCKEVRRVSVTPGASDASDPLPASLIASPARLLAYRVELLNAAGRTAGPSVPVYAASGPTVVPLQDFHANPSKTGVVLEWTQNTSANPAVTVELDRTTIAPASAPVTATPEKPGTQKEPVEVRFIAGASDAGGAIDRSARLGYTYRYIAQRVSIVTIGGQSLEIRSLPSTAATLAVADRFPPDRPAGLVTSPALAADRPAIDLSWEPNMEPRIAGYIVYRRDPDGVSPNAWLRLTAEAVRETAYRDLTVTSGQHYAYRITAINQAGHESAPTPEVQETAPVP